MDAADKAGRDVTSVAAGPRRAPVIAVLEGQSKRLDAVSRFRHLGRLQAGAAAARMNFLIDRGGRGL